RAGDRSRRRGRAGRLATAAAEEEHHAAVDPGRTEVNVRRSRRGREVLEVEGEGDGLGVRIERGPERRLGTARGRRRLVEAAQVGAQVGLAAIGARVDGQTGGNQCDNGDSRDQYESLHTLLLAYQRSWQLTQALILSSLDTGVVADETRSRSERARS